jgi:hypothetical protein
MQFLLSGLALRSTPGYSHLAATRHRPRRKSAMWYVAHLLFAQKPKKDRHRVKCETCQVLLRASSAIECYDRAVVWAKAHEDEGCFRFVGVQHINSLDEERPDDGTEVAGHFFDAYDVWQKVKKLIPNKRDIPAVMWESHRDAPIRELITPKQNRDLRDIFER